MTSNAGAVEIACGSEVHTARLDGTPLGVLRIRDVDRLPNVAAAIREALDSPIGLDRSLCGRVEAGQRIGLVVSDSFRQTRADEILPVLLDALHERGTRDEDIEILFSTGTHRAPTVAEQRSILGEQIYHRLGKRAHVHDAHDTEQLAAVGATSRGTQVEVNRRALECDRLFVTGGVVLHYFGGYGGGRKSLVPGLASAATIAQNHSLNLHPHENRLDPAVRIGALDGNPVAEDMLEAAKLVPCEGIVNTVLDRDGHIAGVFAGELDSAHRAACAFAESIYQVPISARADIVLAASPTTANYVQTHKALFNAHQALKPGGRVVLIAPCPEGLGSEQFTKWLDYGSPDAIIEQLRRQSDINGQTALSTRWKAPQTCFVTGLSDAEVTQLGGTKATTLQAAVDWAVDAVDARKPTHYVMPQAAYTVPHDSASTLFA